MTIRPITPNDRNTFITLSTEFFNSTAVTHPIPPEYHVRAFEHMMADDRYSRCYFAETEGNIAGYVLISLTYSREAGGMAVWIEELYIRPEYRGIGLGGKIIDYILASHPDAKRFRLEITADNPAEHLYIRKGFERFHYEQFTLDRK